MKIVHVIVGLDIGGAEVSLERLIQAHSRDPRFSHEVISLTTTGPIGLRLQDAGISVRALGLRSAWQLPVVVWRLSKALKRSSPDIVHCWMYHADLLGGLCARAVGSSVVLWSVRNSKLDGERRVKRMLRYACARLSSKIPSAILCVAEAARRVHADVGYYRPRMLVVPNGYDLSAYALSDSKRRAMRGEFGFAETDLVVGSIGRFTPAKDHEGFLKRVAPLMRDRPEIKVLMIGRGVDRSNRPLCSLIEQQALAGRVVLAGERGDVPACLQAIDIFCLHSLTEGFPNALGEAMAAGLPCVATNVGDAALMLGDSGFVAVDSSDLPRCLSRMMDLSREARLRMGGRARQRIERLYSTHNSVEKVERIYTKASAVRASGGRWTASADWEL